MRRGSMKRRERVAKGTTLRRSFVVAALLCALLLLAAGRCRAAGHAPLRYRDVVFSSVPSRAI